MMEKLTDVEVIDLVLAGEKEKYKELVSRYQEAIFRYLSYLTGNVEIAKDATQMAFVKAYVNLNGYDRQQKFSSWLYRIAHNEVISLIRKEKHLVSLSTEDWLKISDEPQYLDKLVKKEEKENLRRALYKLSAKDRQIILLSYLDRKSYEEIADILHTGKNNVASKIRRAKQKLLKLMKEEDEEN